jgi:hypothetical protein
MPACSDKDALRTITVDPAVVGTMTIQVWSSVEWFNREASLVLVWNFLRRHAK